MLENKKPLVVVEGGSGSGKTTAIKGLESHLGGWTFLREPGGTDFSESIREILLSEKNHINKISELLLFEAARADLVHRVIIPALTGGNIILLDRFYDSTTAYQGYGRGIPLDFIKFSNEISTYNVKPDITFYFDIPLETALERSNDKELDRMESAGDDFFERVINGYREIAKLEPERILMIDGRMNKENIFEIIVERISRSVF